MGTLEWIQSWYASHCDGDWEHDHQILIETLDNPGWDITIDLGGTELSNMPALTWKLFENSEEDWYGFMTTENQFKASGDPSKLQFLLEKFRELVESQNLS